MARSQKSFFELVARHLAPTWLDKNLLSGRMQLPWLFFYDYGII
jgi:hypothetical protein